MRPATSSLPVPRSPMTRTGRFNGAAWETWASMSRKDGDWPIGVSVSGEFAMRAICLSGSPVLGGGNIGMRGVAPQVWELVERYHCVIGLGAGWHGGCKQGGRPDQAATCIRRKCHDDHHL